MNGLSLSRLPVSSPCMTRRAVMTHRHGYEFVESPEDIWNALEEFDHFALWWPWLEEFEFTGDSLVTGAVLHGTVAPPLPYRLHIDIELLRCEKLRRIEALVHRDLEGEASFALRPQGVGSHVEVAWTVEMMQRPMRLADRMAHPMLQWGHDRVVENTIAGFRRRLAGTA